MNIERVHKQILTSKLLFFAIVFAFVSVRIYSDGNQIDKLSFWGCLLIQMGIAFLLLQLNHIFNIIQGRTFLPALLYLLFIGSNPVFYNDLKGSIAALCLALCYYFLFDSYQKPKSQINAMNISLLLVLGSLLWTPLLIFFPIFWIGFYRFQSFNWRVFFASLTGFLIVYLFVFSWSIFQGDKNIFLSLLPNFGSLFTISKLNFTVLEWITYGFVIFIFIIIGIYLFFIYISEKIWTIFALSYLYLSAFFTLTILFVHSEYKSTLGLICFLPIAILAGHFFSRTNKNSVYYLSLVFFLFFIGIGIGSVHNHRVSINNDLKINETIVH